MDKYKLLNELKEKYGDQLIEELANLIYTNGTGDCYGVVCSNFCGGKLSCFEAIKLAVLDILEGKNDD